MREREWAKERRHPSKWNSKVAAQAEAPTTLCVCVLKNYIAGAVLHNGWIAFLSKISMNMSIIKIIFKAKITKNANTWDFVRRDEIPWHWEYWQHSTAAKKSCWHWQFLLDFLKKMKYLSSNFLVYARITHSHPVSFSRLGSFLCLCFYL